MVFHRTASMLLRRALLNLHRLYSKGDVVRWRSSTQASISGREVIFESGHIARLADGAAVVSHGDTAILATVMSKNVASESDFLPLTVDFQQSASAVGRIPTNYLRRELQQSDADILASRLIDRSIRPLFPKNYYGETQVICKPLALDDCGDAVVLGMNAVSAALAVSDVPWDGPLASVRVALIDNQIVINPSRQALKNSAIDLVLAGCENGRRILMIDMDGEEISTDKFMECTKIALLAVNKLTEAISRLRELCGKEKRKYMEIEPDDDFDEVGMEIETECYDKLVAILSDPSHHKLSRDQALSLIGDEMVEKMKEKCTPQKIRNLFTKIVKKIVREVLFQTNKRCDGRSLDELRPIDITVDVHKKLHGSALFQRGQTQVLSTVTFDAPSAAFRPDYLSQLLGSQEKKMFMLHYHFPQFATSALSTSKRMTRRELGHGALAEKALKRLVPADFPYCIRLACEVLESNGSSSMASVCGGSLALLDAGVKLRTPVAGVAVGLMTSEDGSNRILTDINGLEDYTGDMDFKIAGTRHGFTAMQLDVKIPGINEQLLVDSLLKARTALDSIIAMMRNVQKKWRTTFKENVPVFESIPIATYQRHILFRSGGFNAKLIESETGAKIALEDETTMSIFAPNKAKLEEAKELLNQIFEAERDVDLIFGAMYKGEIVEILEYGVMIRLQKGMKPILLKNNNLDTRNVAHPQVLGFKVGQKIIVQYLGRDPVTGHHRISRKTLQTTSFPVQSLDR